ncbi:MAG: hypothetical protein ABSB88_09620 [Bryobacteraceae bacterium]|jgi:hypothetical protein
MADTEDPHDAFFEGEEHAVVAEPEPKRTGHIAPGNQPAVTMTARRSGGC